MPRDSTPATSRSAFAVRSQSQDRSGRPRAPARAPRQRTLAERIDVTLRPSFFAGRTRIAFYEGLTQVPKTAAQLVSKCPSLPRRQRARTTHLLFARRLRRRRGARRIHVGPVRPDDRPQLLVDGHLPEELRVAAKRLEHGSPQLVFEVDLSHGPVVEGEAENEALKRLDRADSCRARASLPLSQLQRGSPEVYADVISGHRESSPAGRIRRCRAT
jgi:hypothetical protein